jgi:dihydroorotase
MPITGELLLRGGTVVDPGSHFFGKKDVLVRGGVIAALEPGEPVEAAETIDATGYYVTPGLIDYHTHLFQGGTESGFSPDVALLPMGVTTAVDQGSVGVANCDAFMKLVAERSAVRVFCTLNVSPAGQVTERYPENIDPRHYDPERMLRLFARYPEKICGLKIRHDRGPVGDLGVEPLRAAVALAGGLGTRLVVHTVNPPDDTTEFVPLLRGGDVFCHCYHGGPSPIIDADGKVKSEIRQARRDGVLFDTADARGNHCYAVIKAALADGFRPDIISTDLVNSSLFGNMLFGLPAVMSKYLSLGLSLPDVVNACTDVPAGLLGMKGRLGTLAPGALADVAVFDLCDKPFLFANRLGETFACTQLLRPCLTIAGGKVVFRQIDFPF